MAEPRTPRAKRKPKNLPTGERHLLALAAIGEDIPEDQPYRCQLTDSEVDELDAYVAAEAAKIRARWTPQREAEARGVDVRACAKIFLHDGRLFPRSQGADAISERLLELPHRGHMD